MFSHTRKCHVKCLGNGIRQHKIEDEEILPGDRVRLPSGRIGVVLKETGKNWIYDPDCPRITVLYEDATNRKDLVRIQYTLVEKIFDDDYED